MYARVWGGERGRGRGSELAREGEGAWQGWGCLNAHDVNADLLEGHFDQFPDAVRLARGNDKVLGLVVLQHQPHGLGKGGGATGQRYSCP